MASPPTLVADRYRLLRQLGTGGMGRVWLAHDETLDRPVAIKEVAFPLGLSDEERVDLRFRTMREARTAARIDHPNVVKIYDVVESEEQPWIVMEYVPSRSVHEVLGDTGPVEPAQAARIGVAVLDALTAAHAAGVLHRDVKPGNVLLGPDGRVVLTDFGLAVFDGAEGAHTVPGLVFGSVRYVAPERAADGTSTPESDLWSLGATLYAAVEGQAPYARPTAMATLAALGAGVPDPPRRAGALKPVLTGLLRRDPRDRLRPDEARRLLLLAAGARVPARRRPRPRPRPRTSPENAGSDTPVTALLTPAMPVVRPRGWRVRAVVAAAGAALVVAATVAAVLVAGHHRSGQPHPVPPAVAALAAPDPVLGAGGCPATGGTPFPMASRKPNWMQLLPGWDWYLDPGGYRIAVPDGWLAYTGRDGRCFREPGDTRWLAVQTWSGTDPVGHLTDRESKLRDSSPATVGYQLVGIEPVDYYQGAADWEYTYRAPSGVRMHAQVRDFLVGPGQGYTILWCTRDFDWQPNLDYARVLLASFDPPA
jgi:eukaryotic-like serine/threonine-protein kinase